MPQRQRKGKRKRTTKGSAGTVALRKVNKILFNQEKKKLEHTASIVMNSTPQIVPLTLVAQGDGGAEREGNSIVIKSISLKLAMRMDTSQTSGNTNRFMIVQDNSVNGAQFTESELLQVPGAEQNIVSALNLDNSQRFRVLWNKVVSLAPNGVESAYREKFMKFNLKARYSGTGATISGVKTHGLFFVHMTSLSSAQNVLTYDIRTRFADS